MYLVLYIIFMKIGRAFAASLHETRAHINILRLAERREVLSRPHNDASFQHLLWLRDGLCKVS